MHRQRGSHSRSRAIAAFGIGGAAAALAAAPAAFASGGTSPAAPQPTPSDTPATHGAVHPSPADETTTVTTTAPTPDFGFQKLRVGVQIKAGDFVPAGVDTVSSTVHIVDTDQDKNSETSDCTTMAPAEGTATFCTFNEISNRRPAAVRRPAASLAQDFFLAPGHTATITQTTAVNDLVRDTSTITVGPCVTNGVAGYPSCPEFGEDPPTDEIFNDDTPGPQTVDDSATTKIGDAVTIRVLSNDSSPKEPVTVTIAAQPGHGSAQVQNQLAPGTKVHRAAAAGSTSILYTPDAGFSGKDTFRYTITNRFKKASTATVTVTIPAVTPTPTSSAPTTPSASSSPESTSQTSTSPPIAETGSPTGGLLGLAGVLLAAGRCRHGRGPSSAPWTPHRLTVRPPSAAARAAGDGGSAGRPVPADG